MKNKEERYRNTFFNRGEGAYRKTPNETWRNFDENYYI